jgi:hypothetical protein
MFIHRSSLGLYSILVPSSQHHIWFRIRVEGVGNQSHPSFNEVGKNKKHKKWNHRTGQTGLDFVGVICS